ncbi:class I SAM-dependent methyltransferase [Thiobacter aerophilum]|uniref:Class I SAM-dependent methyltransferase n=1 Tax=Thiobacter aerophilum TaxID=3121275 RepID=A0ABV0EKA4_9BURK
MSMAAEAPSPWVMRWARGLPRQARVLDLAAGSGRHARWLAAQGFAVEAVDRDASALAPLAQVPGITPRCADLEQAPWPYAERSFDAIVVSRYLHRPLFPLIEAALAPGGLLIYETFMVGNEAFGRPSNPAFLLGRNELMQAFPALSVLAFAQGYTAIPRPAMIQRLSARR